MHGEWGSKQGECGLKTGGEGGFETTRDMHAGCGSKRLCVIYMLMSDGGG